MSSIIFVYGSLKRGFHNQPFLEHAEYIGDAFTQDRYVMVKGPHFPFLVKQYPGLTSKPISGELYKVDKKTLSSIDILEGNGFLYHREKVVVRHCYGEILDAWVYFLVDNTLIKLIKTPVQLANSQALSYYAW